MSSGTLEQQFDIAAIASLPSKEVMRVHLKHLNSVAARVISFTGLNQQFIKAEGIHLTDAKGRDYLDFISGYGACNLGHEPQEVLSALKAVEGKPNILQSSLNPYAAKLAELLARHSPGRLNRVFFCNSGTEGVEAALKLARIVTGRRILLSTNGAFHGKTFGSLSVSGKNKYRIPFEPLLPDTQRIDYDDLEALEGALRARNVAGFIVEPIQGENGIIVPRPGYLKQAELLCKKYETPYILDEVQTGMGRTGRFLCAEYEEVTPDILVLSKSLGGGVMPIGAMLTTDRLWKKAYGSRETCLLHTSTFGGNSRACACGIAAVTTLLEKNLIPNAYQQGSYLLEKLEDLKNKSSILKDVRGKGLMIGLHFERLKGKQTLMEGALSLWVVRQLFHKYHIATAFTLNNYDVLRIYPPLSVTREQITFFFESLSAVIESMDKLAKWGLISRMGAGRD